MNDFSGQKEEFILQIYGDSWTKVLGTVEDSSYKRFRQFEGKAHTSEKQCGVLHYNGNGYYFEEAWQLQGTSWQRGLIGTSQGIQQE